MNISVGSARLEGHMNYFIGLESQKRSSRRNLPWNVSPMRVEVCLCFCASTKPGASWVLNKYLSTGRTSVVHPPLPTSAASSSYTLTPFLEETQGPGLPPQAPFLPDAALSPEPTACNQTTAEVLNTSPIAAKHAHIVHTHKRRPRAPSPR